MADEVSKNMDNLSVDVNTLSQTVDDMQNTIYNLRKHINGGMDIKPLLSLKEHNGSIKIDEVGKKILIQYIRSPTKQVRIHRESLLLLYMLLPDKFTAKDITELISTLKFIDINSNAPPQLIMKFFAFVFKDSCSIISKGKSKIIIEKN